MQNHKSHHQITETQFFFKDNDKLITEIEMRYNNKEINEIITAEK